MSAPQRQQAVAPLVHFATTDYAGITRGRWYARMNDPKDWTVDELRSIARVLDVPLDALIGEDEEAAR